MTVAQIWKSTKFTIERSPGITPSTVVFKLTGPFTARDMHGSLSPSALRNTFEAASEGEQPSTHIIDLTEVPYIDSAGLGMLVTHHVRCRNRDVRLVLAGVNPRVLQLLEMTKVDKLFPMTATVEEADQSSAS